MNVDDWEEHRPWRRYGSQLKIPYLERRRMLKEFFSDLEIMTANEEVRRVHVQRLATIQRQKFEKFELLAQKVVRNMKRAFLPRKASANFLDTLSRSKPLENRRDMMRKYASASRIDVSTRQTKEDGGANFVSRPGLKKKWASERIFHEC
jgi:hypothetical protein